MVPEVARPVLEPLKQQSVILQQRLDEAVAICE
jgi:hypothetical protein